MEIILFGLSGFAFILFILSFFLKDRTKLIEKELEELSLTFFQENYQIKKRMKILEEEIMVTGNPISFKSPERSTNKRNINEIIRNQVLHLYRQGLEREQIAAQSSLSLAEVNEILAE
ncbi:hypothetical protein [Falsibacillus albus]|uniref:Resolvase HTH domain-containing protein n=1 Tax=Falsibacillus albus TaxID=2478915 RepID=A0A3L7K7L4_9BACI|nr:hypothetical protein [Falsibacillus albus]RLQ98224.1 hypothetical protein D9X91_02225 [Falsibacillus albus]